MDVLKKPNRFLVAFILVIAGAALGWLDRWIALQLYHADYGVELPLVLTLGPLRFFDGDFAYHYGPMVLYAAYGLILGLLVGTRKTVWFFSLIVVVHLVCAILEFRQTKFLIDDIGSLIKMRIGLLWIGAYILSLGFTIAAAWYAIHRDEA
jgi:hypothetical protein